MVFANRATRSKLCMKSSLINNRRSNQNNFEGMLMGIVQRVNSALNFKIEIDLNKRINRNQSLAIIGVLTISLIIAGYCMARRWIWVDHKSYYENEVANLNQQLKKYPGSDKVRAELAMTNYFNGDTLKAINILRNILDKDPESNIAQLDLGLILSEQKQYKESIRLLTGYLQKNGGLETRLAYFYLGQNYLATKRYDSALYYLKNAASRDPGNPVIYFNLGQTYEKLKDSKNAILSYEKALEINGGYVEADQALKLMLKNKQK